MAGCVGETNHGKSMSSLWWRGSSGKVEEDAFSFSIAWRTSGEPRRLQPVQTFSFSFSFTFYANIHIMGTDLVAYLDLEIIHARVET